MKFFSSLVIILLAFDRSESGGPIFESTSMTPAMPSICARSSNVYDLNGNYLKSICLILEAADYNTAAAMCNNNGMNLFAITNAVEYTAVSLFAFRVFSNKGNVWINGQQEADNTWYVNNPNKTEIYSPAAPRSAYTPGSNCLSLTNIDNEIFQTASFTCYSKIYLLCEY